MGTPLLLGADVIVRTLCTELIADYLQMFSQVVRDALHVSSVEAERDYLETSIENLRNNQTMFYCIIDRTSEQCIGAIEIRQYNVGRGQLYTWMNEQFWGTGYFAQALELVAAEYFKQTGELYFTAHVDYTNIRSCSALLKNGFAHAGLVRGPLCVQYKLLKRDES